VYFGQRTHALGVTTKLRLVETNSVAVYRIWRIAYVFLYTHAVRTRCFTTVNNVTGKAI
jgi:hypothetical protein